MLAAIIAKTAVVVPGKNAVTVPGISRQRRHFLLTREPCEVTLWREQGLTNITVIYHSEIFGNHSGTVIE
jgi:hypothetical protein